MRLIAFTTEGTQIRKILEPIGVDSLRPPIAPARGPPPWEDSFGALDKLAPFASFYGVDYSGLALNAGGVTLQRQSWTVP